ncbi:MAG: divergent PAP2 family protein [Clostridia bacterium]|nr:divergent PAP2 family protein [Clostridia bacterium]
MDVFLEIVTSKFVYLPVITWFFIQVTKVIVDLITTKKFNFKRILGAGGMPSSHSAVVCCLTALVGKEYGFSSGIFAISLIFAFVVMYDAAGVRRAAGKQAKMLNQIIETPGLTSVQVQEKLVEVLGHTPKQVIIGAIVGFLVGGLL